MVTSPVLRKFPGLLGIMFRATQVFPPSVDTSIGPFGDAAGVGMNAVAAISSGLAGWTARYGSLSRFTSSLMVFGIILITCTACARAWRGGIPAQLRTASKRVDKRV